MKALAAILAILSLLAAAFVERRAGLCGQGLLRPDLPYGLRTDWFNGMFWLVDSEGWGVVAPPVELRIGSESLLQIERVNRYALGSTFVLEVSLQSGGVSLLSIDGFQGSITTSLLHVPDDSYVENLAWVDVDPASCFFGRPWVPRSLVLGGLTLAALLALRSKSAARRRK